MQDRAHAALVAGGVGQVGVGRLSASMGFPGQSNRPDVQEVVARFVSAVLGAGRVIGDTANDAESAADLRRQGYRMLDCGFESYSVGLLKGLVTSVREAVKALWRPARGPRGGRCWSGRRRSPRLEGREQERGAGDGGPGRDRRDHHVLEPGVRVCVPARRDRWVQRVRDGLRESSDRKLPFGRLR